MTTSVQDILDNTLRILGDSQGKRFKHQSILDAMLEAIQQFSDDSQIKKVRNYVIPVAENQEEYSLPSDFLSLNRVGFAKNCDALIPMSTQERDNLGSLRFRSGRPLKYWEHESTLGKLGLWPIPSSAEVPSSSLVTPTDGDGAVYAVTPATDLTGHLNVDYTAEISIPSPWPTYSGSLSSNPNLDSAVPDRLWNKFHYLVAHIRLTSARRMEDQVRARSFKDRYQNELLSRVNRSRARSRNRRTANVIV